MQDHQPLPFARRPADFPPFVHPRRAWYVVCVDIRLISKHHHELARLLQLQGPCHFNCEFPYPAVALLCIHDICRLIIIDVTEFIAKVLL